MLSFPHLVVLFVIALVVFGPEKLPELARMLGKATAEFRKMTSDFRYALEDEVRELERQTRIRDEESAAAARAAQTIQTTPEGSVPRTLPVADVPIAVGEETKLMEYGTPDPNRPSRPLRPKPVHNAEQAETAPPEHCDRPSRRFTRETF